MWRQNTAVYYKPYMRKFLRTRTSKELAGLAMLVLLAGCTALLVEYGPGHPRFAPATAHAADIAITGYAWSDTIGWVSFSGTAANGSPYGVTVGGGGVLSGYAWSDNIGWITFGPNSCGAQANFSAGALSGFAQATGAGGGWDGCISLSGASPAYGVTLSGTTFTGYAWGSDVVGWLSFSGTATDGSPYAVVYGGAGSPTCTLSVAPNPAATGSSITLNYTTTNTPDTGVIKDAGGATITSGATAPSGAVSATAPSSAGSYTYTMDVASLSGASSCSTSPALSAQNDTCQDMDGIQSSRPGSCTGTPPLCVQLGYASSGSGDTATCVPTVTVNEFAASPARVRRGETTSLAYNVASGFACSITGSDGSSYPVTADGTQRSITTNPITGTITYTLSCGSVSRQATAGLIPAYQEL